MFLPNTVRFRGNLIAAWIMLTGSVFSPGSVTFVYKAEDFDIGDQALQSYCVVLNTLRLGKGWVVSHNVSHLLTSINI